MDDSSAWLLGLIWSDGYLSNKGTVAITSKDVQMIVEAEKVMDASECRFQRKSGAFDLYMHSRELAASLIELGLHPRKSVSIKWPSGLQKILEWSFIRGVMDGDGCVSLVNVRRNQSAPDCRLCWYSASPDFADAIVQFLAESGLSPSRRVREMAGCSPFYTIKLDRISDVRRAFECMYPAADVSCLHRKRDKLKLWYETPRIRSGRKTLTEDMGGY